MEARPIPAAALGRLIEQTARTVHSRSHSHGLFPAQWSALRYFATAEPPLRSATALAAYQGMAFGPVSRTVRTMIAKGYIRKSKTLSGGRLELIEVTDSGHAMLVHDPILALTEAVEALPEVDKRILAAAFEAIIFRLQGAAGDSGLTPEA